MQFWITILKRQGKMRIYDASLKVVLHGWPEPSQLGLLTETETKTMLELPEKRIWG